MPRARKASDTKRREALENYQRPSLTDIKLGYICELLGNSVMSRADIKSWIEDAMRRYMLEDFEHTQSEISETIKPALHAAKKLVECLEQMPQVEQFYLRTKFAGISQKEGIPLLILARESENALKRRIDELKIRGRYSETPRLSGLMRGLDCLYWSCKTPPMQVGEVTENDLRQRDEWMRLILKDTLGIECPDPLEHPARFRALLPVHA
jgi:hypothetical protein